eukprot:g2765.t1
MRRDHFLHASVRKIWNLCQPFLTNQSLNHSVPIPSNMMVVLVKGGEVGTKSFFFTKLSLITKSGGLNGGHTTEG